MQTLPRSAVSVTPPAASPSHNQSRGEKEEAVGLDLCLSRWLIPPGEGNILAVTMCPIAGFQASYRKAVAVLLADGDRHHQRCAFRQWKEHRGSSVPNSPAGFLSPLTKCHFLRDVLCPLSSISSSLPFFLRLSCSLLAFIQFSVMVTMCVCLATSVPVDYM